MERTFPRADGDEREVLTGWLDWQRATVGRKADGLSESDARRRLLPTSPRTTVAGVVSHLRSAEWNWFCRSYPSLAPATPAEPRDHSGWDVDDRPLADLVAEYDAECERSRRIVAGLDLDQTQEFTPARFSPVTLRWIVTHMIGETARHLGHLDILRERLDGTRGH